jgi:hypothetical protein
MRSALPIHTSGSPAPPKMKNRECSRNRPRMLRTRIVSDSPGTPGRSAHIPRTHTSTGTPACEARYSASMMASSTSEFSLIRTQAARPSARLAISRSTRAMMPLRSECGASSSRR